MEPLKDGNRRDIQVLIYMSCLIDRGVMPSGHCAIPMSSLYVLVLSNRGNS